MPSDEFLGDRKKALEDQFFARHNQVLVDRLRQAQKRKDARAGLSEISGITDDAVLQELVSVGIQPETWAALSLVPLVEVAWANSKIEAQERTAILGAAEANGVAAGSPSHALLEGWLKQRPDGRLLEAWAEYIVAICAKIGPAEKRILRDQILGRAHQVAQAAGGFLGLGSKISPEEQVVLSQLAKPFEDPKGTLV